MAPIVDMSDKNAWDDSVLIDSWDNAVNEYKKYHSIHQSGKRLEDVLTTEELKELREYVFASQGFRHGVDVCRDYGDLMEDGEVETASGAAESNSVADRDSTEILHPQTQTNRGAAPVPTSPMQGPDSADQQQQQRLQDPSPSVEALSAPHATETLADALPQAILGTVQDEKMKNMMMSWYFAGYYTGLHAGQQQARKDANQ
ncbi:SMN domain containing protein [Pyrenophora tritici-repentis]|nr:SMN domain containing protein [Pyrenophora tritici-repentis]KAI0574071.1 SMN domain-containing protein [Pyrenophora tritici-repentis]KAI0618352.1 SMN domain-containing protein [Pyrenophora tritici-repentis]KAI1535646.1 SMN domain containing protein [Pyrenophora tritici-repentis]